MDENTEQKFAAMRDELAAIRAHLQRLERAIDATRKGLVDSMPGLKKILMDAIDKRIDDRILDLEREFDVVLSRTARRELARAADRARE